MSNRWIRFTLAVLAVIAATGAAYRIVADERLLAASVSSARAAAFSADTALSAVDELKSTLHAYVAPGQGTDFWSARARILLDKLRTSLLDLDAAATAKGVAMGDSLDASDRLAAAEHRVLGYARTDQALLAGEIIFGEARDLIDGMRINIVRVREELGTQAARQELAIRREQMYLVGGGAGVLILVMLLLVPTGRSETTATHTQSDRLSVTATPEVPEPADAVSIRPTPRPAPTFDDAPAEPALDLAPLAKLCRKIAAVSTPQEIETLVDGARLLLGARGVIVWMATSDRTGLQPVATAGYDARLLARVGTVSVQDDNLTCRAFRAGVPQTSTGRAATALAVPLPSAVGVAGIFSAEFPDDTVLGDRQVAVAEVIAAQFGGVLAAAPAEPNAEAPSQVQQR